jgi:hypothetical protein
MRGSITCTVEGVEDVGIADQFALQTVSDAGLLVCRKLDDVLSLTIMSGSLLLDAG